MALKIRKTNSDYFLIIAVPLLIVTIMAASGCEPLRKKFTRQKKKDLAESSKFVPVLDPIDYPDKVEAPQDSYRHYFSLWQVWDKELLMRIEEHASDKKINFTFNQVLVQLAEMEKLLTGEKQKQLSQYIAQLNELQKELAQPVEIRNDGLIQKKVQRIGSSIRMGFRFRAIETSLVR